MRGFSYFCPFEELNLLTPFEGYLLEDSILRISNNASTKIDVTLNSPQRGMKTK